MLKAGDLVQILPARVGYYVVLGKVAMEDVYVGRAAYWDLHPLSESAHVYGGPMDEKYIEVVSEI